MLFKIKLEDIISRAITLLFQDAIAVPKTKNFH